MNAATVWGIFSGLWLGSLVGAIVATVLEQKKAAKTHRALESTIRQLEKQLSSLADHTVALEKTIMASDLARTASLVNFPHLHRSAAQNPQNDRLNPVSLPHDSQVVKEPQKPSGA